MVEAVSIRFRVDPADVPPSKAARRLHLTLAQFEKVLPDLLKRGFPPADVTTGMFDLEAIDSWRRDRFSRAPELTAERADLQHIHDAPSMAERFHAVKDRQTQRRRRNGGAP